MQTPALHLGTTPWMSTYTAKELTRQAVYAESLGYQSFWLPESHFGGIGSIPDPLLPLAAIASSTKSIRLGTTSLLLPLRHPVLVAEQVAVLDQLSEGRVILGVGRGFRREMLEVFGVEPKLKRRMFEDCLEQMIKAWNGTDLLAVSGNAPLMDEVRLGPETVQKPHPPVWVAAFGPKALKQAGSFGLPYLASPIESFERLLQNYASHSQACTEAGHVCAEALPVMRNVFISRKKTELDSVKTLLNKQMQEIASSQMGRSPALVKAAAETSVDNWAIVGEPNAVFDKISLYREQLGMTHLINARMRIEGLEEKLRISSLDYLSALFR